MSIDPVVAQNIENAVVGIERKHDVRVLFAAESGSRAWGFASPDSDYDVRFIYVHRPEWYWRIDEPRDVIEAMLPGDLDLSGWDLKKALAQYKKCNASLNEWLRSPIIYRDRGHLANKLRDLLPAAFIGPAAFHHYLSMAKNIYNDHLQNEVVNLKKVFYVLRPLMALRWIHETRQSPPTRFDYLLSGPWIGLDEIERINALREQKAKLCESDSIMLDVEVREWLFGMIAWGENIQHTITNTAKIDVEALNELMRAMIDKSW